MSGTEKAFCVLRGAPRSSATILRPVCASSLARMPPVQPMPTMTMSTGGSLVAIVRSSGHVCDADGISGEAPAVIVLLHVLGVVGHDAREAKHLPGNLVLVAAVDRVGEHALHHVLVEHSEKDTSGQPPIQCDLAGLQVLEKGFLLLRAATLEALSEGLAAIRVRARDRGTIERGRRQR